VSIEKSFSVPFSFSLSCEFRFDPLHPGLAFASSGKPLFASLAQATASERENLHQIILITIIARQLTTDNQLVLSFFLSHTPRHRTNLVNIWSLSCAYFTYCSLVPGSEYGFS